MTVVLNSFNYWEFVLFDSIYEFLRTMTSWCNFLYFDIKKHMLVLLIVLLKFFQSSSLFKSLYFLNQILFILLVNSCTTCSRTFLLEIFSILSSLINSMSSVINLFSSSLFLTIVYFLIWINSLLIAILTVRGVWSKESLYSG